MIWLICTILLFLTSIIITINNPSLIGVIAVCGWGYAVACELQQT